MMKRIFHFSRCFNEESCVTVPDAEGYVMVLQPEEPKISLSGIDHFARSAAEFESQEGVTLFPELRIVSTITREVEADTESEAAEGADDDPTGKRHAYLTPALTPDYIIGNFVDIANLFFRGLFLLPDLQSAHPLSNTH